MGKLFVFDLDGTLANIEHRLHFIHKKPKDWKSFLASVDRDTPNPWVVDLLNAVRPHGETLVLTGRSETTREATFNWLLDHNVMYDYLVMRKEGDNRQDTVTKPELLDNFLRKCQISRPFLSRWYQRSDFFLSDILLTFFWCYSTRSKTFNF